MQLRISLYESTVHLFQVFEGKINNITKCGQCGNDTTETSTFISILLSIDAGNDKYDMV